MYVKLKLFKSNILFRRRFLYIKNTFSVLETLGSALTPKPVVKIILLKYSLGWGGGSLHFTPRFRYYASAAAPKPMFWETNTEQITQMYYCNILKFRIKVSQQDTILQLFVNNW